MTRRSEKETDRKDNGATIDFPVVGVGASAGGIEAAVEFFRGVGARPGMAFILIQHLRPKHESHLVEILGRRIELEVVEARDGTKLEMDKLYVIAPGTHLTLEGRMLVSRPSGMPGGSPPSPIDVFFRSLAENGVQRAIGVILSGTGSDGTLGLKAIKEKGGMTMAQDPEGAGQAGMPRSAIRAGIVDYVLPVRDMAEKLKYYVEHPYVSSAETLTEVEEEEEDGLAAILKLLRVRANHDFEHYREPTLHRRTQRRMSLKHIRSYPEYLELLREDSEEVGELARDLLVSVTDFFRDPEAWDVLKEEVIRPLVHGLGEDATIRAWVPGCATGEEAYSLAIVIKEELQEAQTRAKVQVFATDVSEKAIAQARMGVYPEAVAGDIGRARLGRFFRELEDDHHYRVVQDVRDMLIFAPQDVIADPPFTRVDLITCRNLLIYLKPETQEKLISLFHFALRENGYLFLGMAEGVGRSQRFATVSKKWKIYRRIGTTRRDEIVFPVGGSGEGRRRLATATAPRAPEEGREKRDFGRVVQQAIINRFSPACVVIDRNHEIQYYSGDTQRFVVQPEGEPSRNLLEVVRERSRSALRGALYQAVRNEEPVTVHVSPTQEENEGFAVRIQVVPLVTPPEVEGLLLVSFEETETRHPLEGPIIQASEEEEESALRQLEHELAAMRDDLRTKIEQLETSNEELRAANEEVRSMNEELQSANEELETSKEELQSLNEELNTVNQQLESKVEELEAAHNDIKNLLSSTDIATLFLSPDLRIRRFTPAMTRLVNLLVSDVGRPITDFARAITGPDMAKQAREVLRNLQPAETEVESEEGRYYLRRLLPYRTEDDRINGVVVTYTDITERTRYQHALERAEIELRRMNEQLEAEVTQRTAQLELLFDVAVAANQARDFEQALEAALHRICEYYGWLLGHAYLLDDATGRLVPTGIWHSTTDVDFQAFRRVIMRKSLEASEGLLARVINSGEPHWVKDLHRGSDWMEGSLRDLHGALLVPIKVENRVVGMLEFFAQTPMESEPRLERTMRTIGMQLGYVFERRELQRRIVELADSEQLHTGEELHDTLGQQITAVTMLAAGLRHRLEGKNAPEAADAATIVEQLEMAKDDVSALIEGLIPIEVRAESLGDALARLADRSSRIYGIDCGFNGPDHLHVSDQARAMHLYRIAQEAITNAVKHGHAGEVLVELRDDSVKGTRALRIRDNGQGFPEELEPSVGVGLRIMRHRASLLGGDLQIRAEEGGGVTVECLIGLQE